MFFRSLKSPLLQHFLLALGVPNHLAKVLEEPERHLPLPQHQHLIHLVFFCKKWRDGVLTRTIELHLLSLNLNLEKPNLERNRGEDQRLKK
jgi:hypothetical protein